jgi:hypothetical protein
MTSGDLPEKGHIVLLTSIEGDPDERRGVRTMVYTG